MELRRTLNQAVLRLGLARFITEMLAPLTVHVGEAWMRGEMMDPGHGEGRRVH